MPIRLEPKGTVSLNDLESVAIDYTDTLEGETLTGTPTVTTSLGATLASKLVNTGTYVDKNGITVAIGKAVLFTFTSTTAGDYVIEVTVDSSGGRRFVREIELEVI